MTKKEPVTRKEEVQKSFNKLIKADRVKQILQHNILSEYTIKLKIKQTLKMATFKRKRDNYDKKKIKKLLKYLRSEFGSCTTHGLPYLVNTELHWFERLFWAAGLVLSGAVIYILMSSQYAKYLAAPTLMSVEMDYFNWNVTFPAIILCPLNKIGAEVLTASVKETLLQNGQDVDLLEKYAQSISLASLDSIHLLHIPAPDIIPMIDTRDYAKLAAQIFRTFDNITLTTSNKWSISLDSIMTELGMCHVINSNVAVFDNPSKWSESVRLAYTKNNIELSFYDRNFFVQITDYANSYKIYTQSPNDIILIGTPARMSPDEEGVLSFGIQIKSIKASSELRAMDMYLRKCRFVNEPASQRYPVYSYNRCLMECRIKMIKIFCGCIPHFYKPLVNERVCNLAELKCLVDYKKEVASLSVNNETMEKFGTVDDLPRNFHDCGCLGDCEPDFYHKDSETFNPEDDVKRLKIVLATFPKVRFLREIIFSFSDIMLRSGSIVNLCIGTSMISIMELLITVIRILIYEIIQVQRYCSNYCKSN